MKIHNSTLNDSSEIFRLYELATNFQKLKFPANTWPKFNQNLISSEIIDNRQFKLIIDDKIACVWAITYSDPQIWEERDNECSVYIHRIATNPEFRGNNFIKIIVDWAKNFANTHHKHYIRMDTCGENMRLIRHYETNGFTFLGMKKLKHTSDLPSHYQNSEVCFFEIKL